MQNHLIVSDNFSSSAKAMRAAFDEKFARPKETKAERFVWDFWHVPDQYTLLRTPADHFFPKKIYQAFLQELGAWALENLGCSAITPPWLSNYIEGCEQQLHSDVPHGPWAFVFSLSPVKPKFKGGETLILKPDLLNYWKSFSYAEDRELNSFVHKVKPAFNRLVVFDPRIPHGVTQVSGTMDPREGRLVLHGWFTDPKPYFTGHLKQKSLTPLLDQGAERMLTQLQELADWHGVMSLRLSFRGGQEPGVKLLANTLVADRPVDAPNFLRLCKQSFLPLLTKDFGKGEVTLPMLFR